MSKDTVIDVRNLEEGKQDELTDLLREGAKRLIAEAVDAELSTLLAQFADYKDESGRRYVVRNGHLPEREIMTGIGPVSVQELRVDVENGSESTIWSGHTRARTAMGKLPGRPSWTASTLRWQNIWQMDVTPQTT